MKKKVFKIIIALIITSLPIHAQNVVDKTKVVCKYVMSWPQDTTKMENLQEELMQLEIGDNISRFFSYKQYQRDSIINVKKANGTFKGLQSIQEVKSGHWKYNIYINYPSGKISFLQPIFKANYKYVEDLKYPQWTILKEKETVLTYPCQTAKCHFRGRDYTAWFTSDIPISAGPYKFGGLPGLILKIKEAKNHYTFECVSIEHPLTPQNITFEDKEFLEITKKGFRKTEKEFITDPIGFLDFNYNIKIGPQYNEKTGKSEKMKPDEDYNPIELTE